MQVFVYGTLKPGGSYYQLLCQNKEHSFQKAKLYGSLYDLGVGYPAIQLGGSNWVYGYVLNFVTEEIRSDLDALEGYEKNRPISDNEYQRVRAKVYALNGSSLGEIDTYVMEEAQLQRYKWRKCPSGEWDLD